MARKSSPSFLIPVLILILIAALAVWLAPATVRAVLTAQLSKITGLPVKINRLDFSLTQPQFLVRDLLLANPQGFPSAELAQIAEVKVQYVPFYALLGKFDLKRVEVNFKELRLVRNEAGSINLPLQPPVQAAGDRIDEVILNLGPVTYTDLSTGQPVQKTYDLGLGNAVYRNVKGVAGILEIVNWEVMKRTGIPSQQPAASSPPDAGAAPEATPEEETAPPPPSETVSAEVLPAPSESSPS